jgi:glucokinase
MGDLCLAVDVGGSKLCAGLVDAGGRVVQQERTRTPRARDGEALFRVLADLLLISLEESVKWDLGRVVVCGVGTGGPMSAGGETISPLNIPAWREFPLRERIAGLPGLGGVPVAVDNDAKALALGEGWIGAGKDVPDYLAMVVSTGIGGGIVLDGRLLDGAAGNAGHIGHLIVVPDGRQCPCGARGCLEAEASGTAIEAITGVPAADASPEMVERTGTLVGRAVASVANLLDLRLALVAGSVALGYGIPFFLAAQREMDRCCRISYAIGARIAPAGLGSDGPLVGAAAVGWRLLGTRGIPGGTGSDAVA